MASGKCALVLITFVLALFPLLPDMSEAADSDFGQVNIEAQIPRGGRALSFGFGSAWIISGTRLARVNPTDNSIIDIDLEGNKGSYRAIGIGEGSVWVPDIGADMLYKVDPETNSVVHKTPLKMLSNEGSIGIGEGAVWSSPGTMIEP